MELSPTGESNSCSDTQKCTAHYGNRKFITVFTRAATDPYPEPDESSPQPHVLFSLRSIFYYPSI
jgi:hypothetical protein